MLAKLSKRSLDGLKTIVNVRESAERSLNLGRISESYSGLAESVKCTLSLFVEAMHSNACNACMSFGATSFRNILTLLK